MNVFKVNIEFDKTKIDNEICKYIKQKIKGYVCVVDANVLTMAQKNVTARVYTVHYIRLYKPPQETIVHNHKKELNHKVKQG